MTFSANHYVPVLKVKRGEKKALGQLSAKVRPRVTPILEIVGRRTDKTVAAHLDTAFKDLAESVRLFDRCFIDAKEIEPDGPARGERRVRARYEQRHSLHAGDRHLEDL